MPKDEQKSKEELISDLAEMRRRAAELEGAKTVSGQIQETLARGTPPEPGGDGQVKLLFKQMPDPGQLLDGDRMDFRERDAVPQVQPEMLLAERTYPTPGKPGVDVRGRALQPPKSGRDLLYAGANVTAEEKDGRQFFYATQAGWARIIKDTLAVLQRFQYRGDLNYKVGNLDIEGDVEIEGTVKSRFKVKATGDIYIGGAVERNAKITAGGNVVVREGLIGARIEAGGNLHACFIQDSHVEAGGDLVVRNYIQDSEVKVQGKAVVQGNEGGERQLCLLGGVLVAASGIQTASIGAVVGRQTQVISGKDFELEAHLERYRKGIAFCDLRNRRAMSVVETMVGRRRHQEDRLLAIRRLSPARREFLSRHLKELDSLGKLKQSLLHHIQELEQERTQMAQRAHIRVQGKAFPRVVLQIGEVYQMLEEEIDGVVFHLDSEGTQIALQESG